MATRTTVDVDVLLGHIKNKYAEVISTPGKEFEFHTRRDLVDMLGTLGVTRRPARGCCGSIRGRREPLLRRHDRTRR